MKPTSLNPSNAARPDFRQAQTVNRIFTGARIGLLLLALFLTGCASTKVSNRQRYVYDQLPRPNHIWVYNFVASPAEIPADAGIAGEAEAPTTPPTEEQIALGRELGTTIAVNLVEKIREMGLPVQRATDGVTPQVNDIVIRGYLVSIEEGSTAKRMTIGFGSGGSQLTTVVDGYQMTPEGLRRLGTAMTGSKSSKGPGAAVGAAGWLITGNPIGLVVSGGMKIYGEASGSSKVEGRAKKTAEEIADQLEKRFKEEGWIN